MSASQHQADRQTDGQDNVRANDQADVEKVLGGDISAFEGIVQRWQGPLVNMAYRFCRDRGLAEEMAQEAFLRAYRALAAGARNPHFPPGFLRSPPTCTAQSCDESPPEQCPSMT